MQLDVSSEPTLGFEPVTCTTQDKILESDTLSFRLLTTLSLPSLKNIWRVHLVRPFLLNFVSQVATHLYRNVNPSGLSYLLGWRLQFSEVEEIPMVSG